MGKTQQRLQERIVPPLSHWRMEAQRELKNLNSEWLKSVNLNT